MGCVSTKSLWSLENSEITHGEDTLGYFKKPTFSIETTIKKFSPENSINAQGFFRIRNSLELPQNNSFYDLFKLQGNKYDPRKLAIFGLLVNRIVDEEKAGAFWDLYD